MPANAILSDKGEKTLFKEGVAIDFVRAAFSHLKAIPVDQGGQMLLKRQMSDRTQTSWINDKTAFIAAAKMRQWDWEKDRSGNLAAI